MQQRTTKINKILFTLSKKLFIFFLTCSFFGFFIFGLISFSKVEIIDLKISPFLETLYKDKKTQKKIRQKANRYKGEWIWSVDLEQLAQEVMSIYPSGDLSIVRRFPNRLIVFLDKNEPVALLLKGGRDFYSLSSLGEIHSKLDYHQSLDFPILRGKALIESRELRKEAIDILLALPKKGLLSSQNISEITYKKKNNSFLFYLISNQFVLEWKGLAHSKKMDNIKFVLNYMSREKPLDYHIDARFDKKIIVNKAN